LPCSLCALPGTDEARKRHYAAFGTVERLAQHLGREFPGDEDRRATIITWWNRFDEQRRRKDAQRITDPKLREWSIAAHEAKSPEELDALAQRLLSPGAQAAVSYWTRMWRKAIAASRCK
jgi:hypothetical protein